MVMKSSSRIDWLLFVLLGFVWGSSYLFIKIGVDAGLPPLTLVMLRLLLSFALLAVVVGIAREPLPRDLRTYGHLIVMSVFSIVVPFSLITWAEQSVDSSLAAIINGAVPLFVIPIAATFLPAERLSLNRVAGVALGFIGVAILVGFDPANIASGGLAPQLALVAATASYAVGGVYARRNIHGLRPMIPAVFQVGFALVIVAVAAFTFERPLAISFRPDVLFAIVWLGLLGSGLAYLLFFRILERWGATRTSMVAYLLPVFGIILGVAVLAEPIEAGILVGAAMVIGGIALVNRPAGSRLPLRRGRTAATECGSVTP
jgi:drug/metabolite transporter (DMT)-like permease